MKTFFGCIRLWRTEAKNGKTCRQERITQDEFTDIKKWDYED